MFSLMLIFALGLALVFSFWTGFTDAAYAISTVIGTRTLKPIQAVVLASLGNLVGMFFGSAVAETIGKGVIAGGVNSGEVIISALLGALIFDVISSWIYSLPISETHVLVGALIGAGMAAGGLEVVQFQGILDKVIIPMVTSPFIAVILAFLITLTVIKLFRNVNARKANKYFKTLQVVSSFFFSMTDGTNDAQKVMGIITILLIYYGYLSSFVIPLWVIFASYFTLILGTLLGGWRVVKTMATKITRLRPYQGFCVETTSSLILGFTTLLGLPVSSTHVANGAIIGVGSTRGLKAVKWGMTRKIIGAWLLSMPLSALFSFLIFNFAKIVFW